MKPVRASVKASFLRLLKAEGIRDFDQLRGKSAASVHSKITKRNQELKLFAVMPGKDVTAYLIKLAQGGSSRLIALSDLPGDDDTPGWRRAVSTARKPAKRGAAAPSGELPGDDSTNGWPMPAAAAQGGELSGEDSTNVWPMPAAAAQSGELPGEDSTKRRRPGAKRRG